jgi:hypothetical protein
MTRFKPNLYSNLKVLFFSQSLYTQLNQWIYQYEQTVMLFVCLGFLLVFVLGEKKSNEFLKI